MSVALNAMLAFAGLYSRKAFERLGFSVNAEYLYEDYISPDGERVFAPLADNHKCTTLMTKRLLATPPRLEEVPIQESDSK